MSEDNSSTSKNEKNSILYFKREWTFWLIIYDKQQEQYQIEEICSANTVSNFYSFYKELPRISELKNTDCKKISIALFAGYIRPAWEDENNQNGGAYCFLVDNDTKHATQGDAQIVDEIWLDLMLMAVGGDLNKIIQDGDSNDNEVCGIVVGPKGNKNNIYGIDIWVKKDGENKNVKGKIIEKLNINKDIKFIYKKHGR